MSEQLKQLQDLQTQLHEVNLDFARAAQPRHRLRHEALGFGACVVLASLPVGLLAYGIWSGL